VIDSDKSDGPELKTWNHMHESILKKCLPCVDLLLCYSATLRSCKEAYFRAYDE